MYVFYMSRRLQGAQILTDLSPRVGPLERTSRVCGEGRDGGGSFVRILRVLEALGG